jgi:type II secretory pathway pseudopilin PulG
MIEILVVITLIAILAAIVVTNVTHYLNRGKNAAVKANLSTALTNSAVYFNENGNYTDYCTSSGYLNPEGEVNKASGGVAVAKCTDTNFCVCSLLRVTAEEGEGSTFCVDSSGFKGISTTDCSTRCTDLGSCSD